jgi:hypothetical protein
VVATRGRRRGRLEELGEMIASYASDRVTTRTASSLRPTLLTLHGTPEYVEAGPRVGAGTATLPRSPLAGRPVTW